MCVFVCACCTVPSHSWLEVDLFAQVNDGKTSSAASCLAKEEDCGAAALTFSCHTHTHTPHLLTGAPLTSTAGCWLKSDETLTMKTKRADFAAAFLRGRMIVAGGLGERV